MYPGGSDLFFLSLTIRTASEHSFSCHVLHPSIGWDAQEFIAETADVLQGTRKFKTADESARSESRTASAASTIARYQPVGMWQGIRKFKSPQHSGAREDTRTVAAASIAWYQLIGPTRIVVQTKTRGTQTSNPFIFEKFPPSGNALRRTHVNIKLHP